MRNHIQIRPPVNLATLSTSERTLYEAILETVDHADRLELEKVSILLEAAKTALLTEKTSKRCSKGVN